METFTIFYTTKYGLAIKKIKASTMLKAFIKLPIKIKMCNGIITDDNDNSYTFNEILGIKEN